MDILEILKTIKEDWALLVFFFSMGAAWWQGKFWFRRVNSTLDSIKASSTEQGSSLAQLQQRMEHLHDRVGNLERTTDSIHEEIHQQEIKLAVLQGSESITRRRSRIAD